MIEREAQSMETVAKPPERLRMTYEDYETWAAQQPGRTEWVDGEVITHMSATPLHEKAIQFLSTLLYLFARFFNLGEVLAGPVEMKPGDGSPAREPDIFFVAAAHLDRLAGGKLTGPADLVVEVVSDDSVSRDLDDKFIEYQEAGVPEYWIIDPRPRRKRALFYQVDEQGVYQLTPAGRDGIYRSKAVPGFWLRVEWLWGDELPDPQLTFAEVAGFAPEVVEALVKMKKGR